MTSSIQYLHCFDTASFLFYTGAFRIRAKPGLFTPGEVQCSAPEPWHETLQQTCVLTAATVYRKGWPWIDRTQRQEKRESYESAAPLLNHVLLTAVAEKRERVLADLHRKNNPTCSWAKNPPSALAVIYEVLTPGPERISILLGKCFPLGRFSATVCRCSGDTESESAFPLQTEWKSMSKKFFSAEFWQWSMTFYCLLTASPSLTSGLCFGCQRPLAAL